MPQTIISVKCTDQVLTLVDTPVIAAGGINEDKIVFEFCPLWNGFTKTAAFWLDKGAPYESVVDTENSCIIPSEVLVKQGNLFFGVYGINQEGIKRTSTILKYKIEKGAVDGIEHTEPTPDIYEQLLKKIAEKSQVQADWAQTNTTSVDYIKNKPTLPDTMIGATDTDVGVGGTVPAPDAGEQDKVLHGDGTWRTPVSTFAADISPVSVEAPTTVNLTADKIFYHVMVNMDTVSVTCDNLPDGWVGFLTIYNMGGYSFSSTVMATTSINGVTLTALGDMSNACITIAIFKYGGSSQLQWFVFKS